MNLIELERALRQLRLGGIAAVLETRLRQAQAEAMAPIDLISCLVGDELTRRSERLLDRRRSSPMKTLLKVLLAAVALVVIVSLASYHTLSPCGMLEKELVRQTEYRVIELQEGTVVYDSAVDEPRAAAGEP